MRGLIQQLLESVSAEVEPGQVITAQQIVQGSAMTEQPEFPFLVHKFSGATPTPSGRGRPSLEVWCYDRPGSYLRIDRILRAVRYRFSGAPFTSLDGLEYIAVADWLSDSPDLPAEEFHGITRMSAFNLVGRSA